MPVQHEESYIYRNGIVVCFLRGGVALFLFFGYEGVGRRVWEEVIYKQIAGQVVTG